MKVIPTKHKHMDEVLQLYKDASINLKLQGVDQWQNNYPNQTTLENDMKNNESFVIIHQGKVIASCSISTQNEQTYTIIEGNWLNNEPYIVLHRIVVSIKHKGSGLLFLNYVKEHFPHFHNIRIDTHEHNKVMQGWLHKHHFTFTGVITLLDHSKRNAYQLKY